MSLVSQALQKWEFCAVGIAFLIRLPRTFDTIFEVLKIFSDGGHINGYGNLDFFLYDHLHSD